MFNYVIIEFELFSNHPREPPFWLLLIIGECIGMSCRSFEELGIHWTQIDFATLLLCKVLCNSYAERSWSYHSSRSSVSTLWKVGVSCPIFKFVENTLIKCYQVFCLSILIFFAMHTLSINHTQIVFNLKLRLARSHEILGGWG